jgi:hypothetical protein
MLECGRLVVYSLVE